MLQWHLQALAEAPNPASATRMHRFLLSLRRIPITLDITDIQNSYFDFMEQQFPALAAHAGKNPEARDLAGVLLEITEALSISPVRYMKLLA
jgi:hypothetical protein